MAKPLLLRIDDGKHRQATWLELFFDLAFVICLAALSHRVAAHPTWAEVAMSLFLFLPVWWVWNQFTWYASHFDNDDGWFRYLYLVAIAGTLVMAVGLREFSLTSAHMFVWAYLFLHVLLGMGWWRAYYHMQEFLPYIKLKILGIGLGLLFWGLSLLFTGPTQVYFWFIGIGLQLFVPIVAWAKVQSHMSVHYHHITERHGLFTIIILGESLIALTHNFQTLQSLTAIWVTIACFVLVASLWWIYFDWRYDPVNLKVVSHAFSFNYGQFAVYAALGLVAAGIDLVAHSEHALMGARCLLLGLALYLGSLAFMDFITRRERMAARIWLKVTMASVALGLCLMAGSQLISLSVLVTLASGLAIAVPLVGAQWPVDARKMLSTD